MKPSPFPAANCSALHTGPAAPRSYPVRCLADLASAYAICEPSGSVRYSLTMRTTKTGKPAGRTRSAEKHEAILTAALELLASQGYVRMTLDQVATAADVSKSTIHLRWKTKADLLTAALATMRMADAPPPSGDIRTDLLAILRDFDANMERVNGMALIGTCLAEEAHTPELINLLRSRTIGPRRALLRQALQQARDRGEIREDADLETAAAALHGSYFSDYLAGRGGRPEWAEQVVDFTLAALRTSGS